MRDPVTVKRLRTVVGVDVQIGSLSVMAHLVALHPTKWTLNLHTGRRVGVEPAQITVQIGPLMLAVTHGHERG